MHHLFPQPINSPSATSLPTKSRIITYSPFFSLHHSWWSPKRFFFWCCFFSQKSPRFAGTKRWSSAPTIPRRSVSWSRAWRVMNSTLACNGQNLSRRTSGVGEAAGPGRVKPELLIVVGFKGLFFCERYQNRKNRRTTYCFSQDFSPSIVGFWAENFVKE